MPAYQAHVHRARLTAAASMSAYSAASTSLRYGSAIARKARDSRASLRAKHAPRKPCVWRTISWFSVGLNGYLRVMRPTNWTSAAAPSSHDDEDDDDTADDDDDGGGGGGYDDGDDPPPTPSPSSEGAGGARPRCQRSQAVCGRVWERCEWTLAGPSEQCSTAGAGAGGGRGRGRGRLGPSEQCSAESTRATSVSVWSSSSSSYPPPALTPWSSSSFLLLYPLVVVGIVDPNSSPPMGHDARVSPERVRTERKRHAFRMRNRAFYAIEANEPHAQLTAQTTPPTARHGDVR